MELLNMNIKPVTRIQYANLDSQNVWGNKISIGGRLYPRLEFETVKHSVRPCMISHEVNPNDLESYMRQLSKQGLILVPLKKETPQPDFSHSVIKYSGQGPFTYRCVVTKSTQLAEEFIHADLVGDDIKIGELLGFPKTSSEFFDKVWQQGYVDPIWQAAENASEESIKFRKEMKDSQGNIERNIIKIKSSEDFHKITPVFRYIGIRVLSHLPVSLDDKESLSVANNWIQLANDLKLEGLNEALDILKLPYEWDCYKGYAEINTPVFKIITSSMPCYPHHVVQQESDFYPKEAPNGIKFPWRNPLFGKL